MRIKGDLRLVLSILLFMAIVASSIMSCYISGKKQTDFIVYYSAALAFREGHNPYDLPNLSLASGKTVSTPYNYPPATLFCYIPLTYFNLITAARIFLTVKLAAVGMLLFLWNRIFDFGEYSFLVFLLAPLAFNGALLDDLGAGNISVFEQLFIWLGFYAYVRNKLAWFSAAIIVASAFKLVSILLLMLLVTRLRRKDIECLVVAGISFMAFLALNALCWPHLFAGFVGNMLTVSGADRGETNPATLMFIKDVTTWFSIKSGLLLHGFLPYAVYLIIGLATIYMAGVTLAKMRVMNSNKTDLWRICLVCLLYAVLMPRLKNYSYIILIAPALYAVISRPLAKAWVPFCVLMVLYTFREYTVLGKALAPFYRAQAEYYSLLIAWLITGCFCYSFLRTSPEGPDEHFDDASPGRPGTAEKPVAVS